MDRTARGRAERRAALQLCAGPGRKAKPEGKRRTRSVPRKRKRAAAAATRRSRPMPFRNSDLRCWFRRAPSPEPERTPRPWPIETLRGRCGCAARPWSRECSTDSQRRRFRPPVACIGGRAENKRDEDDEAGEDHGTRRRAVNVDGHCDGAGAGGELQIYPAGRVRLPRKGIDAGPAPDACDGRDASRLEAGFGADPEIDAVSGSGIQGIFHVGEEWSSGQAGDQVIDWLRPSVNMEEQSGGGGPDGKE